MPFNAPSLRHALEHANTFHWITGNLAAAFPPAGGAPGDPWKGLSIAWDKYAPRRWPARVSPWEARPTGRSRGLRSVLALSRCAGGLLEASVHCLRQRSAASVSGRRHAKQKGEGGYINYYFADDPSAKDSYKGDPGNTRPQCARLYSNWVPGPETQQCEHLDVQGVSVCGSRWWRTWKVTWQRPRWSFTKSAPRIARCLHRSKGCL